MAIVTYPLNDIDYDASDVAIYNSTRTTGIYADDDFVFGVTGEDNYISIGVGLAWMRLARFSGVAVCNKESILLDLGLPPSDLPRIDAVVLQYSANANRTQLIVKHGMDASEPLPPERVTQAAQYEIHLYHVRREPGNPAVTAADVTDLRLYEAYCGLMADSVTRIDTSAIEKNFQAMLEAVREELNEINSGSGFELRRLQFNNIQVAANSFIETGEYEDYPLRASVPLMGVSGAMVPEVVLSITDAAAGNIAPAAQTYDGGLYLYAASELEEDLTIPVIMVWR